MTLHAEVLREFAQPSPWEHVLEHHHLETLRKRLTMRAERHPEEPQAQPPCEECQGQVPPPTGRKKVRHKRRRFCCRKCAARHRMRELYWLRRAA